MTSSWNIQVSKNVSLTELASTRQCSWGVQPGRGCPLPLHLLSPVKRCPEIEKCYFGLVHPWMAPDPSSDHEHFQNLEVTIFKIVTGNNVFFHKLGGILGVSMAIDKWPKLLVNASTRTSYTPSKGVYVWGEGVEALYTIVGLNTTIVLFDDIAKIAT